MILVLNPRQYSPNRVAGGLFPQPPTTPRMRVRTHGKRGRIYTAKGDGFILHPLSEEFGKGFRVGKRRAHCKPQSRVKRRGDGNQPEAGAELLPAKEVVQSISDFGSAQGYFLNRFNRKRNVNPNYAPVRCTKFAPFGVSISKLAIMKSYPTYWNFCSLLRLSALVFVLALRPCYGQPQAESEINSYIQAAIAKSLPGFDPHIADESDGYVAAIVVEPIPNEVEHEMKVAVFRKAASGQSYQLLALSKSWKEYLLHRVGWSIQWKGESILLSLGGSTSCCSGFDTELRFRKIGEAFRLVGEESWSHGTEGSDSEGYYEARTSINYLTGKVIHYKIAGPARDCRENESAVKGRVTRQCFDGRPRSKEVSFSFSTALNMDISAFDPDSYFSYKTSVPELCGYLNEKMKYEHCKHQ